MAQLTFSRKEKKYLMTQAQYECLLQTIAPYVAADRYANYTICNIYYDTPQFDLIRRSIEKTDRPTYKEKLRVRSYHAVTPEENVFLELKKKYDGVVYKRRLVLPYERAQAALEGRVDTSAFSSPEQQILREVQAFCELHRPIPALYLAYDREAYSGKDDSELRITFDRRIRYRWEDVNLLRDEGELLLPEETVLLELKLPVAMPLWLVRALDAIGLQPTSFSKYGEIYKKKLRSEGTCHEAI